MQMNWHTSSAALALAMGVMAGTPQAQQMIAKTQIMANSDAAASDDTSVSPLIFGDWGVDLTARDTSVKPGDDFDAYANGGWFAHTEIPDDQGSAGVSYDVYNLTQRQLRALVLGASADSQVGGLYQSFMDEARVDDLGVKPLMADIAKVDAIQTKSDMARFMGTTQGGFGLSIISAEPYSDSEDPTMNSLWMGQDGLGLPEREYYLDDQFKPQRDAYRAYIVRTLTKIGNSDPEAGADAIMAFETDIAMVSWKIADRRDISKINNPMSSDELSAYAPGLDWAAWFAGAGIAPQIGLSSMRILRSAILPRSMPRPRS